MRFDLTNASLRVLDRASKRLFPGTPSEISPAKLLLALFEEEECRAADWLAGAGLSEEQFRRDFGLEEAILQSPISAPNFPMGDYGVPPGMYQATEHGMAYKVEASPAEGDAPPVGYPDSPMRPEAEDTEHHVEKRQTPPREPDDWNAAEPTPSTEQRIYSPRPKYRNDNGVKPRRNRFHFFLDDQPVSVGRISVEVEESLEIILHRFARNGSPTRKLPGLGGGVVSVINRDAEYFPSFSLATEHLLLTVVLDDGDAGQWLRDHGFEATELYRRIEGSNENETPDAVPLAMPLDMPDGDDVNPTFVEDLSNTNTAVGIDEKLYRLLDAAINRAREAVRVIEDFARFVLDNEEMTRRLKDFRHRLQEISHPFSNRQRLDARNTTDDVGTAIEGLGEYRRLTPHDVLSANFARLQESLRSLEEYSKLVAPELSRQYETLRYRCYSLHKLVCLAEPPSDSAATLPDEYRFGRRTLLRDARLYALVDCRESEENFVQFIESLINGGVDVLQLRDKKADDRTLLSRAKSLKQAIEKSHEKVLFVMNDRPDLALLADADAVHVGQEELSVEQVRRIVGVDLLIGVSTHDMDQARRAMADGADYLGAGPVFKSSTKEFQAFPGLEFLKQISEEIKVPVFAIGGISSENLDEVLATGATRIAVGAALLDAEDPGEAARDFRNRLPHVAHPDFLED